MKILRKQRKKSCVAGKVAHRCSDSGDLFVDVISESRVVGSTAAMGVFETVGNFLLLMLLFLLNAFAAASLARLATASLFADNELFSIVNQEFL